MKTIKAILKELLRKPAGKTNEVAADQSSKNQKPIKNHQENETENHESVRVPQLDNPDAGENPGNNQKPQGGERG